MPCTDNMSDHALKNDLLSLSIYDSEASHHHTATDDDCSTLCGCHCCHSHVFFARPAALSAAESAPAAYINYNRHFNNTVVSPFLRPPIA